MCGGEPFYILVGIVPPYTPVNASEGMFHGPTLVASSG